MTNHLTDEQRERIARAMGWSCCQNPDSWQRGSIWFRGDHEINCCPRYDEPGELHEEMVAKYRVWRSWANTDKTPSAYIDKKFNDTVCSREIAYIAECLAVLAYLDSEEGEK